MRYGERDCGQPRPLLDAPAAPELERLVANIGAIAVLRIEARGW